MAGKIQNADIKSLAELQAKGADKPQLLNTDKMYTPKSDEILETTLRKNNFSATVDPTPDDDVDLNYEVGSIWININTDKIYFCVDNSDGAAIWKQSGGPVDVGNVQNITAAGEITLLNSGNQVVKVQGDGAAVTTSNTPFGTTPPENGTIIRVEGRDNANTVTIPHADVAGGTISNGDQTLGKWDTAIYRYDSTDDRYIYQGSNF